MRLAGWIAWSIVSTGAIAAVVAKARHDSADPARCGGELVPFATRCCAQGQHEEHHGCVGAPTHCPTGLSAADEGCVAVASRVFVSGGELRAGAGDWEAEGRVDPHDAAIAPFAIDRVETTEQQWLACVRAGRCASLALSGEPGRAAAGMTRDEAAAYCAFAGGRLPTDDEWTWAAGGARARRYPWGGTGAVCRRGAWGLADGPCGYGASGPELAGVHPDGASPDGILDLAGNVAEWVAPGPHGEAWVRGGSFATALATELRTWERRSIDPSARSRDVGVRCAYSPGRAAVVP
jgi:sulfatase modifying factor 1